MNKKALLIISVIFFTSFLFVSDSQAASVYFDLSPKLIPGGQESTLNFTWRITSSLDEVKNKCSQLHQDNDKVFWTVYDERNRLEIARGENNPVDFGTGKTLSGQGSFKVNPRIGEAVLFRFYFLCQTLIGRGPDYTAPIVKSSLIEVEAVQISFACVNKNAQGQNIYDCRGTGTKQSCEASPACQSKQCVQIDTSRCGQSAGSPGSPGGPGPGQPGQPAPVSFNIPNPIQAESLIDLAKAISKFLFQIAIPIAVIVIIYAGLLFLTSGGNKEQYTKASKALWYAVIGLAIILIGQGFFTLVKSILDLGGPASP